MSATDSSGTRHPPAPEEQAEAKPASEKPSEGWLDRFRALIRLRGSGSLRSDLAEVLAEPAHEKADFSPIERAMLQNILELRERRIGDVMVPRADIIAVQQDIPLGELLKVFANAGHSRLVVYDDTLDDPTGMVHIRDIVAYLTERAIVAPEENAKRKVPLPADLDPEAVNLSESLSQARIIRRILFVPPSMPVIDLLVKMQATRIHLALVIDEYGGTDGLVSIEDIVEEIVGEIEDEHDEETPRIERRDDGSFIADARAGLDEAREAIGPDFEIGGVTEEVDTLGGYLVTLAGRVPVRGEILRGPQHFEIEILDADPRRVKRLRIYRRQPQREPRRRRPGEDASGQAAAPEAAEARQTPADKTPS
ncbi:MAG TPA: hemolysin family protein [Xanthobacteraceae bacterium]|nr:hemolysin family protein [Xanthobacteraceae bacterium]